MASSEQIFDEILKKSLKKHREPIRDDFARELLAKIQMAEQQNALRKVVLQERVSLAAFILLPLAAIAVMFVFPDMVTGLGRLLAELPPLIIQALITLAKQWQLLAYYALALSACLYAAYEVLRPEN
ncbi:MAG: hypothetical protein KJ757_05645 [Planctomycetes bacterium]|nr:hypothetical protein [Planctomycetota bacterium]MBU1517686.1 hypothetical protein [Planctomycetota bacterium]MBU2458487.1 hypothetical protein [Planctomycetota bacterium]MBU2597023.1 hypothetical protein [Planctomycetota bacterium]